LIPVRISLVTGAVTDEQEVWRPRPTTAARSDPVPPC
jgi:hypothetical protein